MEFLQLTTATKAKAFIILAALFFFNENALSQAPPVQWAHNTGVTAEADYAYQVETDVNNDVYTLGYYEGLQDFDPGPGVTNISAFGSLIVSKKNNNGNFVWAMRLPFESGSADFGVKMLIDEDEIILSGKSNNTADIDPVGGSGTMIPDNQFFLARYSAYTGALVSLDFTAALPDFRLWDMALDPLGNVVQIGQFNGTQNFNFSTGAVELTSLGTTEDNFIAKYDASGNLIWAEQIGGLTASDEKRSISISNNGEILLAGSFSGTIDIDPDPIVVNNVSSGISSGGFVLRVDGNGDYIWGNVIQNIDVSNAIQDVVATNTNVFVYGSHSGTTDFSFGGGLGNSTASATRDIFISRYSITGNYTSHQTIGGTASDIAFPKAMKRSNTGLVYLTGSFNGSYDFDPGVGLDVKTAFYDWYQVCFSATLTFQWSQAMGGTNSDLVDDMAISKNGNVVITGTIVGEGDMDPTPATLLIGNNANTTLDVADAMYGTPLPEINVTGNSIPIPNNSTTPDLNNLTDFGDVCLNGPDTAYFKIQSTGMDGLLVTGVTISGPDAAEFQISNVALNILSGGEATLQVIAFGNSLGVKNATITIDSDDSDESSYKFDIRSSVQSLPVVNYSVSPNETVFCAGDLVTFNGSGANTYSWNFSITDGVPVGITTTGHYQVIGTSIYGCKDTNSVAITVNPLPAVFVTSNDPNDAICLNDSIQLIGAGAASYTYTGMVVDQTNFSPPNTDLYTITGTDGNGCMNTDTITITVNSLPMVSVTSNDPNDTICLNDAVQLIGAGATSYSYTAGVVDQTDFTPIATETYYITGTDGNGCMNNDSITIGVNALPMVTVTSTELDDTICINDTIQLIGGGATSYSYSGGVLDQTDFNPSTTETYYITGTDGNGCMNNDSITIHVEAIPTLDAGGDLFACFGDSVLLDATGNGTITWTGGLSNNSYFSPTMTSQELISSIVTSQGCINSDTILVNMGAQIDDVLTTNVDTVFATSGYDTYVWFDCSNDVPLGSGSENWITVGYDGDFYAVITDANNCTDTTDCVAIQFSSIDELSGLDVQVFPNPTNGVINIQSDFEVDYVEVYDNTGRMILSNENVESTIDLSSFARGNYLLKVFTSNGQSVLKRVVKH